MKVILEGHYRFTLLYFKYQSSERKGTRVRKSNGSGELTHE